MIEGDFVDKRPLGYTEYLHEQLDRARRERDEARREIVVLIEDVLRALEAPVDHAWLADAQESVVEEAKLMVAHRDGALRERDEARRVAVALLRALYPIQTPPLAPEAAETVEEWSRIYPSIEEVEP